MHQIQFTDVLYVPSLMANLLSVGQLATKGLGTTFTPGQVGSIPTGYVFERDEQLREVPIFTVRLKKKIYVVDQVHTKEFREVANLTRIQDEDNIEYYERSKVSSEEEEIDTDNDLITYSAEIEEIDSDQNTEEILQNENEISTGESESEFSTDNEQDPQTTNTSTQTGGPNDVHNHIWHCRLGHPHPSVMRSIGHSHKIDKLKKASSKTEGVCHACLAGKGTKRSRSKKRNTRTPTKSVEVLEVVMADTCGPISPESKPSKYRYFQLFIDDATNYTTIAYLNKKTEGLENFEVYRKVAETLTGRKLKRIKTDNGTYYRIL